MGQNLGATVVITTLGRRDDLRGCLHSIAAQETEPDRVVVVDDGDVDATRRVAETFDIDVRCVEGPGRGLPASRNAGVELVDSDVVCFVDDDVVLPPNWLSEILRVYEDRDPDGVGGSVVNYTDEEIGKANMDSPVYRVLTVLRTLFFHDRIGEVGPMGMLYAPHTFVGTRPKRADTFQGCNMTFRTDVFEEHRFDEWYGEGGSAPAEELAFCTELTDAGKELIYTPRAVVIHKRTTSGGERSPETNTDFRALRNLALYTAQYSRYGGADLGLLVLRALFASVLSRSPRPFAAVLEGLNEFRRRNAGGGRA